MRHGIVIDKAYARKKKSFHILSQFTILCLVDFITFLGHMLLDTPATLLHTQPCSSHPQEVLITHGIFTALFPSRLPLWHIVGAYTPSLFPVPQKLCSSPHTSALGPGGHLSNLGTITVT